MFDEWILPTEQLVLLFAEMLPKTYIDDLMQMFPTLQIKVAKLSNSQTTVQKPSGNTPISSKNSERSGTSSKGPKQAESSASKGGRSTEFMSEADMEPAKD